MDPPAGFAPAWTRLQDECLSMSATGECYAKWRSRKDLHLELPPSQSGVHDSYTSGTKTKMVRYAGAAPATSVWKTDMFLLHQYRVCYKNRPMEPVSRRPGRFFKPLLIC